MRVTIIVHRPNDIMCSSSLSWWVSIRIYLLLLVMVINFLFLPPRTPVFTVVAPKVCFVFVSRRSTVTMMVIAIVVFVAFIFIMNLPLFVGSLPDWKANKWVVSAASASIIVILVVIQKVYWSTTTISGCTKRMQTLMVMVTAIRTWMISRAFSCRPLFVQQKSFKEERKRVRKRKTEMEIFFFCENGYGTSSNLSSPKKRW